MTIIKKPDSQHLLPYWKLKVIGGSLLFPSTSLIHPVLPQYAKMKINFALGGGIYTFKGVKEWNGIAYDITILFDGTGGHSTIREVIN